MLRLNKNIEIFFNYFLGPILFIWLSLSIYHQVKNQPNLELSWEKIKEAWQGRQSWMLAVVVILMGVNWGIEARKWQVLLKPLESMSWWKAFKGTLAGVAFAVNTPNRIGEYGGRIIYVKEGNRTKAISLTLVGSISQFLVTLLTGCGGLIFLLTTDASEALRLKSPSYAFWLEVILYIVAAMSMVTALLYFRLNWLVKLIDKLPGASRLAFHIEVVEKLDFWILLRVLSLSFGRYLVFACQYVLMLWLMQITVTVWQAFWLMTVVFLVLAVVPTIALAEIGLRGEVSLELFGLFSNNKIGIITSSVGIWVINLIVPALLGSILILRTKIFKNK